MDSLIETSFHPAEAAIKVQAEPQATENQAATPYEPFLQDWYPAPVPRNDAGSLTLTNRQMAIIGFIGILGMGLMAGLAYAAGRVASNGPSRVLVMESASAPAKTIPPMPALPVETLTTPAVPQMSQPRAQKPSPVTTPVILHDSPLKGLAFWQVGALDPGMAKVSEKYLLDNGVPVRLETTAGSSQVRVLAGPAEGVELGELKIKLDNLGFQSFLKRF